MRKYTQSINDLLTPFNLIIGAIAMNFCFSVFGIDQHGPIGKVVLVLVGFIFTWELFNERGDTTPNRIVSGLLAVSCFLFAASVTVIAIPLMIIAIAVLSVDTVIVLRRAKRRIAAAKAAHQS